MATTGTTTARAAANCWRRLLPLCRYFAYIQVVEQEQNLWQEYAALAESPMPSRCARPVRSDQIYPVFRELFSKEGEEQNERHP
ncbi:MAG: DUF444 family protein [Candidatus Accumulibacter contiguus]